MEVGEVDEPSQDEGDGCSGSCFESDLDGAVAGPRSIRSSQTDLKHSQSWR